MAYGKLTNTVINRGTKQCTVKLNNILLMLGTGGGQYGNS